MHAICLIGCHSTIIILSCVGINDKIADSVTYTGSIWTVYTHLMHIQYYYIAKVLVYLKFINEITMVHNN